MLFIGLNLDAIELRTERQNLVENEKYQEDYLFAGNQLEFSGEAKDLYSFGEQIDFSGKTTLALIAAGQDINVTGSIGNGVKAAGQTVNIEADIRGTSFLAGKEVTLGPNNKTVGDTLIGAGTVNLLGKMTGDLYVGAGEISIQNEIHGDVKVYAGQLTIPEQGRIFGNLTYESDQEISEEEASRVTGNIQFKKSDWGNSHDDYIDTYLDESIWISLLFKLSFIILGMLVLLFPINKVLEKRKTHKEILSYSLWGLIPIFVYPSAILLSIILLITLPLAAAMGLAFLPLLFMTKILGITMIGSYLAGLLNLNTKSRFIYFLLAGVLYSLLSLIPYFGIILMVFVSAIGWGLIISSLFNRKLA